MKKEEKKEKLQQVYDFTQEFIEDNGFPPSVREICNKCNIKSTATAFSYLEELRKSGLIEKSPSKNRAISLPKTKNVSSVPLIGTITAGTPIFAVENLEGYCPLPADFSNLNDCFALRVKGDSMINAGIYNRDIIIVKKQNYAYSGEIVVALIDDSATVKRFYKENGKVILHPENNFMKDMIFESDVTILGTVKGLIRKF
ncbi:MAG: transcriptional repressor LexA [Clostridia bacterium]|nr:transcriptional repressor LexA [Clostridia bacterium]